MQKRKIVSVIIRFALMAISVFFIVQIAVYIFRDEHKITTIFRDIDIDFSTYTSVDELRAAGKSYLDQALNQQDQGIRNTALIKNYGTALAFFTEMLKRKQQDADALVYTGIIKGMLADMEEDVMMKLTLIKEAFHYLDQALILNEHNYLAMFWNGIFSVEVPDTIFNRLVRGLSYLNTVRVNREKCDFLTRDDYYSLLVSIGKAKKESGDASWKDDLETVIKESGLPGLIKTAGSLLDE